MSESRRTVGAMSRLSVHADCRRRGAGVVSWTVSNVSQCLFLQQLWANHSWRIESQNSLKFRHGTANTSLLDETIDYEQHLYCTLVILSKEVERGSRNAQDGSMALFAVAALAGGDCLNASRKHLDTHLISGRERTKAIDRAHRSRGAGGLACPVPSEPRTRV